MSSSETKVGLAPRPPPPFSYAQVARNPPAQPLSTDTIQGSSPNSSGLHLSECSNDPGSCASTVFSEPLTKNKRDSLSPPDTPSSQQHNDLSKSDLSNDFRSNFQNHQNPSNTKDLEISQSNSTTLPCEFSLNDSINSTTQDIQQALHPQSEQSFVCNGNGGDRKSKQDVKESNSKSSSGDENNPCHSQPKNESITSNADSSTTNTDGITKLFPSQIPKINHWFASGPKWSTPSPTINTSTSVSSNPKSSFQSGLTLIRDSASWPTPDTAAADENKKKNRDRNIKSVQCQQQPQQKSQDQSQRKNQPLPSLTSGKTGKSQWTQIEYTPTVAWKTSMPSSKSGSRGFSRNGKYSSSRNGSHNNSSHSKQNSGTSHRPGADNSKENHVSDQRSRNESKSWKKASLQNRSSSHDPRPDSSKSAVTAAPQTSKQNGISANHSNKPVESDVHSDANATLKTHTKTWQSGRSQDAPALESKQGKNGISESSGTAPFWNSLVSGNSNGDFENRAKNTDRKKVSQRANSTKDVRGRGNTNRALRPTIPYFQPHTEQANNNAKIYYQPTAQYSSFWNSNRSSYDPNDSTSRKPFLRYKPGACGTQKRLSYNSTNHHFNYLARHVTPDQNPCIPFVETYEQPNPYVTYWDPYSVLNMVSTQVQYYFSVENLCKDMFLRRHMNSSGYLDLNVIAQFNRMKVLTTDFEMIKLACSISPTIEHRIGPNNKYLVRVRSGWEQWVLDHPFREPNAQEDIADDQELLTPPVPRPLGFEKYSIEMQYSPISNKPSNGSTSLSPTAAGFVPSFYMLPSYRTEEIPALTQINSEAAAIQTTEAAS